MKTSKTQNTVNKHLKHNKTLKLVILLVSLNTNAQHSRALNYNKFIIDTLSSSYFSGRGYAKDGEEKAATFIKNEFEKLGVLNFNNNYFQEFTNPTSSINQINECSFRNKKLNVCKDYIILPNSPNTAYQKLKIYWLKEKDLKNNIYLNQKLSQLATKQNRKQKPYSIGIPKIKISKKVQTLLNELQENKKNILLKGIIYQKEKLIYTASSKTKPKFEIHVNESINKSQKINLKTTTVFTPNHTSQNVIGYIKGKNTNQYRVITAHYDHLGMMGQETYFAGANDNASGIAMLLDMAKHYSKPENQPEYNMVFIAFGAEEIGLVGSQHFVKNPLFSLGKINFLVNLDLVGTGEEGITVVNGTHFKKVFERLEFINKEKKLISEIKARKPACNSDHCLFFYHDVPCFYIYTRGGSQAYHNPFDTPEKLSLYAYDELKELLITFMDMRN